MHKVFLICFFLLLSLAFLGCRSSELPTTDLDGESLFKQTTINQSPGCVTCHALEPGVRLVGPSLAGIGSRAGEMVTDPVYTGSADTAAGYLKEAIVEPDGYVPDGFISGAMYQDYGKVLSDAEIQALVDYMLTLK